MAQKLQEIKQVKLGEKYSYKIVNQPAGLKSFVSEETDTLTAFKMPMNNGVYAFLAHNFLAGKHFFELKIVSPIEIIDIDGNKKKYIIRKRQNFQAVDSRNPRSDFIDLKTKQKVSATDLFEQIYQGYHRLVLQTCITKGEDQE